MLQILYILHISVFRHDTIKSEMGKGKWNSSQYCSAQICQIYFIYLYIVQPSTESNIDNNTRQRQQIHTAGTIKRGQNDADHQTESEYNKIDMNKFKTHNKYHTTSLERITIESLPLVIFGNLQPTLQPFASSTSRSTQKPMTVTTACLPLGNRWHI